MRAVRLSGPGPVSNLRLTTLPLPPERGGWVRIRVEAFGLNRSELKLRLGVSVGVTFPRVPGIEAAGTVDASPAGRGLARGQKAVAMMGDMGRTYDGGYAEVLRSSHWPASPSPPVRPTTFGPIMTRLEQAVHAQRSITG